MTKFPEEADTVRQYIRDNVERPKRLPEMNGGTLAWSRKKGMCCPLGLLRQANVPCPFAFIHFKTIVPFNNEAFISFLGFWDTQTDPQYAVDTVWSKE